jgi:hypothetical protein
MHLRWTAISHLFVTATIMPLAGLSLLLPNSAAEEFTSRDALIVALPFLASGILALTSGIGIIGRKRWAFYLGLATYTFLLWFFGRRLWWNPTQDLDKYLIAYFSLGLLSLGFLLRKKP